MKMNMIVQYLIVRNHLKEKLQNLQKKNNYANLLFAPKEVIENVKKLIEDESVKNMNSLKDSIAKNTSAPCNALLTQINSRLQEWSKEDTLIERLANGIGRIYPLPDFEYQYNVPRVKNVDYLVFRLDLKGKDVSRNTRLNMTGEEIQIPMNGGWRIDFTTGPFLSVFSETVYDLKPDTMFSKRKPDSIMRAGTRLVSQKRKDLSHFGIATMLQIYPRQFRSFNFSPISRDRDKHKSQFINFGRCKYDIGQEQRASLSFGYSCNYIKELSPANKEGDFESADYTIKTIPAFKSGYFVSFCYNIGLTSKTNTQQPAAASDLSASDTSSAKPATNKKTQNTKTQQPNSGGNPQTGGSSAPGAAGTQRKPK